jgi:MinD-like ATPase involved in chromosome partitioning or flagellar assembly
LKIELNQKSNSRTEIIIDTDLKFGKIGAVFGIIANRTIKTEIDNLINRFANAKECSN